MFSAAKQQQIAAKQPKPIRVEFVSFFNSSANQLYVFHEHNTPKNSRSCHVPAMFVVHDPRIIVQLKELKKGAMINISFDSGHPHPIVKSLQKD